MLAYRMQLKLARKFASCHPQDFVACKFKTMFGEMITTDTAFQYPVEENALPTINWELSSYDVIIVDEISIIPKVIFKAHP